MLVKRSYNGKLLQNFAVALLLWKKGKNQTNKLNQTNSPVTPKHHKTKQKRSQTFSMSQLVKTNESRSRDAVTGCCGTGATLLLKKQRVMS